MSETLQKRIYTLVQKVFAVESGAWMVWCDADGHWQRLLQRVATDKRLGGFELLVADARTAGALGSPTLRRDLQARLDAGASFVLYMPGSRQELGWLWAQALLAERIYDSSLRSQLLEWGWKPTDPTMSGEDVATLALALLQQDPAQWNQGGLQPDLDLLLEVLAEGFVPDDDHAMLLQITIEAAGLPPFQRNEVEGWRAYSLARLLVNQAYSAAPEAIPDKHPLLTGSEQRTLARQVLARWVDSNRFAQALPDLVSEADRIAELPQNLAGFGAEIAPLTSRAAEYALFANTCATLSQASGTTLLERLAALQPDIERHQKHGFWGYRSAGLDVAVPWGELQRLCAAAQELLAAMPEGSWPNPQAAIAWYVSGGWRMDRAGEAIMRSLTVNDPELVRLVGPLRDTYRARWEDSLINWSTLWNEAGCPLPDQLPSAGQWLKSTLDTTERSTAILVVDALRFDLGATLAENVNRAEQVVRAQVLPARAPLPSITALGMAQALPIAESALVADLAVGKWRMQIKEGSENLSDAEQRRLWWKANFKGMRWMTVGDTNTSGIPAPNKECRHLVIHDDALDKLGHDDQLEFAGSDSVLKRYQRLIERLRDEGWRRILAVTDHGFIQWPHSDEKSIPPPLPEPAYKSRRAAAYAPTSNVPGPRALAPGGKWLMAFPYGAASFSAYGGLGYFHGGASLQEWIIPCVGIEWPVLAKPVAVKLRPIERVMSLKPKLTIDILATSLFKEESIPRHIEIVVRDAKSRVILFASEPTVAQADRSELELALAVKPGVTADRNTRLRIELRDPNTENVIDTVDAKLMIEISEW